MSILDFTHICEKHKKNVNKGGDVKMSTYRERMYIGIIKKLVSALTGAPYPPSVNEELYGIWYEHSREAANEALEFIAKAADAKTTGVRT